MEYKINLDVNHHEEESFELIGDNIGQVLVLDDKGNNITNQCRVQITLSKNGLLGLGTELVRLAHQYRDGKHFHIDPINVVSATQSMGIMLHPHSCELIICCGEFDAFDKYMSEENE